MANPLDSILAGSTPRSDRGVQHKIEPAPGLVLWILRPLVWLVGVLLASSKDTKNTPEKTFFVLLLGLRLPFC
jgi:hypothetical protein